MAKQDTRWGKIVEDYFTFAKFQRRAVLIFLAGIILLFLLPALWHFFAGTTTEKASEVLLTEVAQLKAKEETNNWDANKQEKPDYASYREPEKENYSNKAPAELFAFDPNTVTVADWKRLGIREKTAVTIQNYLSKGGHFYKPEDLGKIYGLHKDEVERLMPYVRIAGAAKPEYKKAEFAADNADKKKEDYSKPVYTPKTIDINTADTTAFIALPGIGSKLAARIVNYREKLGGFHSVNQIGETYGLADSTFQKIKTRLTVTGGVRKININTASATELKMPYLPYNVVNAIVQYRNQHGAYKTVDDIRKVLLVDEALFNKVSPYLKTE